MESGNLTRAKKVASRVVGVNGKWSAARNEGNEPKANAATSEKLRAGSSAFSWPLLPVYAGIPKSLPILFTVGLLHTTHSTFAYEFTGAPSSDWESGSNWVDGSVPKSSDNVVLGVTGFPGPGATLMGSGEGHNLKLGEITDATLTIQGGALTLSGVADVADVAADAAVVGVLNVDAGGVLWANSTILASQPGATGYLDVNGAGAGVATETLSTGERGEGIVTIDNGGFLQTDEITLGSFAGTNGTLTGSGIGSVIDNQIGVEVGLQGYGALTLSNGAALPSGALSVARFSGSGGMISFGAASGEPARAPGMLVSGDVAFGAGDGAILSNHTDTTGGYEAGARVIGNGSILSEAGNTRLSGDLSFFSGDISVDGGSLIINSDLNSPTSGIRVGANAGGGHLQIEDGADLAFNELIVGENYSGSFELADGTLETNFVTAGAHSGGNGSILVSGPNSDLLNQFYIGLGLGDSTLASMRIEDGATVDTAQTLVGFGADSHAVLEIDNASWDSSSWFHLGSAPGSRGTVIVTNDGVLTVDGTRTNIIGREGTGTLVLSERGELDASSGTKSIAFGTQVGSKGTLAIGALSGEAAAAPGRLLATAVSFGDGDGAIVFNHSDNSGGYEFSAGIGGNGEVLHEAGQTRLSGNLSSFSGGITVDGGTLITSSDLNSPSSKIRVGRYAGGGQFQIEDGAKFTVNDLIVGERHAGSVILADGSLAAAFTAIGMLEGGSGKFDVRGTNSTFQNNNFFVLGLEKNTNASVLAEGGSNVESTVTLVGYGTGSRATLEVDNASWINSSSFVSAYLPDSEATTTVTNGGRLTLDGTKTTLLGHHGIGALVISNGGVVDASSGTETFLLGNQAGASGTIAIGASRGKVAVEPGTLFASSVSFGDGQGSIIFNHTDTTGDYEFSASVIGNGEIIHEAGQTHLTGDLSGFSGRLDVLGGTLLAVDEAQFSASLTASGEKTLVKFSDLRLIGNNSVRIANGAAFQAGKLDTGGGALVIGDGGKFLITTIDDGPAENAITTVSGSVELQKNSRIAISASNLDGSPDLVIKGALTIEDGAFVQLSSDGLAVGDFAIGDVFPIMAAAGSIEGTFGSEKQSEVESDFVFLDPALTYDADNVYLELLRKENTFKDLAQTTNELALGGVIGTGTIAPGNKVYNEVVRLTDSEVSDAYNHLTGEIFASNNNVVQNQNFMISRQILARLENYSSDSHLSDAVLAFHGERNEPENLFEDVRIWFSGLGAVTRQQGSQNTAFVETSGGGFSFGVESNIDIDARVGAAFTYFKSFAHVPDRTSKSNIDTYSAAVYGKNSLGAFSVSALLQAANHQIETSRYTAFDGIPEELSANYGAWSGQAYLEGAYEHIYRDIVFEPFAGFSLSGITNSGFVESGNAAALDVEERLQGNAYATLGLRLRNSLEVTDNISLELAGEAGWRHAFGDVEPDSMVSFASGSDTFNVVGAPLERDTLLIGLSAVTSISDTIWSALSYRGQYGSSSQLHNLRASFEISF